MPDTYSMFERRVADRSAIVGVIGLGYVGLPLCRAFHDAGFHVMGFDVDPEKVESLLAGRGYLRHLGEEFVDNIGRSERFVPTNDMGRLGEADALIICVPTPLDTHLQPDLSYVRGTAETISKTLRKGQLVVLESTTYPGTTRGVLLPIFEETGMRLGDDFFVAFSPEREDPGRQDFNTSTIPKLVGGLDEKSTALSAALYRQAIEEVKVVESAEVAESAKLLENIFRAVNIALVNEMKVLLTSMDINVWDVIEAAATKPFGFMPFYPGPGLGGHCIPIDPFYLTYSAREAGLTTRFIELAGEINRAMPDFVIERTSKALNERKKPVSGSRILILGLAYKPDIEDARESPSFLLIKKLVSLGAHVDYNDPLIGETPKTRAHDLSMTSVPLSPETLSSYDCVIVATHHSDYDWQEVADHAQLVIDTRNALKGVTGKRDHIVLA